MFRMSRGSFADLEEELDPFLRRDEMKATASSGSPISTRTRLAVTLRWLAGGSHIDLCFAWGIAHSTFYSERGIFSSLIPLIPSFPFLSPDSFFPFPGFSQYKVFSGRPSKPLTLCSSLVSASTMCMLWRTWRKASVSIRMEQWMVW